MMHSADLQPPRHSLIILRLRSTKALVLVLPSRRRHGHASAPAPTDVLHETVPTTHVAVGVRNRGTVVRLIQATMHHHGRRSPSPFAPRSAGRRVAVYRSHIRMCRTSSPVPLVTSRANISRHIHACIAASRAAVSTAVINHDARTRASSTAPPAAKCIEHEGAHRLPPASPGTAPAAAFALINVALIGPRGCTGVVSAPPSLIPSLSTSTTIVADAHAALPVCVWLLLLLLPALLLCVATLPHVLLHMVFRLSALRLAVALCGFLVILRHVLWLHSCLAAFLLASLLRLCIVVILLRRSWSLRLVLLRVRRLRP